MAQIDYRIRIFDHDANWVDPDVPVVDYTFLTDDIDDLDEYGGMIVRPLTGQVESRPWEVTLHDTNAQITSILSDADGYSDLNSRLIDIAEGIDGGGFTVRATGRIEDIQLADMNSFIISVVDELYNVRLSTIFGQGNTTSIYPGGILPTEPDGLQEGASMRCVARDGNVAALQVRPYATGVANFIFAPPKDLHEEIRADITDSTANATSATEGQFATLRARVSGIASQASSGFTTADYEVRCLKRHANPFGPSVTSAGSNVFDEDFEFTKESFTVEIIDPDSDLTVGHYYYVNLAMFGHPPTTLMPYHIGVLDHPPVGKDRFRIAQEVFDEAGVRYDDSLFAQYDPDALPEGLFDHPLNAALFKRITGPVEDALQWLNENVFSLLGYAPFIGADGKVRPKYIRMPNKDVIDDVTALFNFDSTNVSDEFPAWVQTDRESINRILFRGQSLGNAQRFRPNDDDEEKVAQPVESLDGYVGSEISIQRDYLPNLNKVPRRVDLQFGEVFRYTRDSLNNAVDTAANELFTRAGRGISIIELVAMPSASEVEPGDWVTIDLDDLPNLRNGGQRGGGRLVQVIEKYYTPAGPNFRLWDAGPDLQPMDPPTITATVNTSRPKHWIDISVSGVTGDWWTLEANISDLDPSNNDPDWFVVKTITGLVDGEGFDTSFIVKNMPSGSTIWFRAKQGEEGRVSSFYSDHDDATTEALDAPTGLAAVDITRTNATLTWTVQEPGYNVHVQLLNAAGTIVVDEWFLRAPSADSTPSKHIVGASPGDTHAWRVRSYDAYGGVSPWASDSFTTLDVAAGTSPDIKSVIIKVGSSMGVVD